MSENFSDRLKKARLEAKIRAKDLAYFAGISPAYLSQLESGVRSAPGSVIIGRFAECLKVSTDWLIAGSELLSSADMLRDQRNVPSGTTDMLRAENAALKAELKQALETISNLSKALARRGEGRAQADGPPANPACGACSGTAPMDQSKSA